MRIFAFFLLGIILFYISLFFPLTTGVIFVLSAIILFRHSGSNGTMVHPHPDPPASRGRESEFGSGDTQLRVSTPSKKSPLPWREGIKGRGAELLRQFLLILFIIIGFLYAFFRYSPPLDLSGLSGEMIIDSVVNDAPWESSSGRFVNEVKIKSALDAETGGDISILKGREMSVISEEGLIRGLQYEIAVKAGRDMKRLNPSVTGDERLYAYLNEIRRSGAADGDPAGSWFRNRRDELNGYLKNGFDGDTAALLSSITTGERSAMSDDLKDAFGRTGLAHLLSISGTHFGLFSVLVFGIFRLIIRYMPYRLLQRFTIYLTPSQAAAILSLPFMLMYLLISGGGIPALRSFLMINIFLFGLLIGRRGFWLNSLLFAALVICLWEPSAVLSASFQLSFVAVFFIGYFLGDKNVTRNALRVTGDGSGFFRRIFSTLKNSLILTLSASFGTAPLVAHYFHYFSIISPVSNLLITPLIGFILVPLSLISAFLFIFTGQYPFHAVVAGTSEIALKGVKFFASLPVVDVATPHYPVIGATVIYAVLISLLYGCRNIGGGKKYLLAFPPAAMVLLAVPLLIAEKELSVTYLDVGQGDCAVMETFDRKTIVVDTGRTGKELDSYLRYMGKRKIDVLILTHADDDHSAGAPHIMKRFAVGEVWDSGRLIYPEGLLKDVPHLSLERGDETEKDGLKIQVLHPYGGFYTFADDEALEENNDSLVVKMTGRKNSFLFTADTAEEAEEDMLHLGERLKSDVLKIAHHGSGTSSSEGFLKAVSPEIGIISVGRNNPYGHPHKETLERFRGVGIYRTDRDGAIKVIETSGGLRVKTARDFVFERVNSLAAEWRNVKRLFMRW